MDFITSRKAFFHHDYKFPVLEQSLYFCVLILVFMTISNLKLTLAQDQSEYVRENFLHLVTKEKGSIVWKFLYFIFKNIQLVVLVIIFFKGASTLNTLKSLGFMIFFVLFASSEPLYRKASRILIFFTAFFILGEYFL